MSLTLPRLLRTRRTGSPWLETPAAQASLPVSRPVTSISPASMNGLLNCGLAISTRLPIGTKSVAPQIVHQRPVQSRTRRSGAPRFLKTRKICIAPSIQNGAAPSMELLRTLIASSQAGMEQVREI